MSNHSTNKIRAVLSVLLSFFLSLLLFLTTCVGVLQTTVFDQSYMRTKLSQTGFYGRMAKEVEEKFVSYGAASGFDESFFEGIVDPVMVQQDIENHISQLYQNRSGKFDTSKFEQELHDKFMANVNERGIAVTSELEQAVALLTDTCVQAYTDTVSIPAVTQIAPYVSKAASMVKILMAVLIVLMLLLVIVLFFLHRWKHRVIRFYIYALSGATAMLVALPVVVFLTGKIQRIGLASASLYHFAVDYLTGIVWRFGTVSLCAALVIVVLGIVYYKLRQAVE